MQVRFQVFKNGKTVAKFALHGAHLFGTDGISIRRARISVERGFVECRKPNLETAGLALLWPIEGFGKILLPTTCLPERDRPYNLNLEIARAKLMQITNKREDWSFFDSVEGTEDLAKEAQDLLISAIQRTADAAVAARLADQALRKAMVLSEKLAVCQGQQMFVSRLKNQALGRGSLGCVIDPDKLGNTRYVEMLTGDFGFVTVPVNWAKIERQKGKYTFSELDGCVSMLAKRRVVVGAGPLLQFSRECLPEWLLQSGYGFEKIRDAAYQFISNLVTRYGASVHRWYVVGGLNTFNQLNFSFEQILEMTRAACTAVRAGGTRSVRIIEVTNPWGDYYATTPNSIPPFVYMDMVVQSGVSFDAFGLEMKFGKDESGMHIRDMMQISAILDCYAPFAKPLHVTGVEVPSRTDGGLFDGKVAGVWHQEWDETRQGHWLEQFYRIALSKPFVEAVTYANLADRSDSAVVNSGLVTEQLEPKESFLAINRFRRSFAGK